jgi:phytanoyl-CoA hydroxylase
MTAIADDDRQKELLIEAATEKLRELEREAAEAAGTNPPPPWIDGGRGGRDSSDAGRSSRRCLFDLAGFVRVRGFADRSECRAMKESMASTVEEEWHPDAEGLDSFGTSSEQNVARGDYFLESATNVHFFAEPAALEKDPITGKEQLKPEYRSEKIAALNKVGHALHLRRGGAFRDYCTSDKVRGLVAELGWRDPVVPQSMYIFKQAVAGGAVHSHQDSTFLYTTPRQTCLGLWLALDDATVNNGCLWVRPKSHREKVRRHYKRNVEHFGQEAIDARSNEAAGGDPSQPKFVMEELPLSSSSQDGQQVVAWDGELPDGGVRGLMDAGFVPVECQAGDLLAFCGELDHLSLPNHSTEARHTFQLHLVEGPAENIEWSKYNWLQYPAEQPFLRLNKDEVGR